ncbi:putative membrane protein [Roseivirga pacifica]|uniref:Putative membrane protein n=1 Tax=Roseivirga pacifica TaxID=1267423 RepID=A0A1I0Q315_9BACT|nr:bestrophin family ion channel [Roseivirga pacifica]MCO6360481.1 hypothetical protein [Roseivirga pacifica]MCO6368370.1 hypothetical protein [Roseivirga pacifica]MCO6372512.1 hypothetical protein [Roseivirga pacifica]MCO6376570.1 hypothetical protein [Roseivirga pacifica]MCO6378150.1 hypothetical protein [Roseivirga pacifica]
MFVKRKLSPKVVFKFGWKNIIWATLWSALVVFVYQELLDKKYHIGIPYMPLSTIGIAVAFYVGFKNNQAYDRFWEGRKIWGGIVNYSRTWANQVLSYLDCSQSLSKEEIDRIERRLVHRHLAWINTLRIQLRYTTIFDRSNLSYVPSFRLENDRDNLTDISKHISDEEYEKVMSKVNPATHINRLQGADLSMLKKNGSITDFQYVNMMTTLEEFYNLQGMCERIKSTPFPRQFAYFGSLFVWIFIGLLPFGMVEEFYHIEDGNIVWLTVPFSALVSWIFYTMEIVGDVSEDPFENYINDVPMTAICRTIERDLLQLIDEEPIPEKAQPVDDILL